MKESLELTESFNVKPNGKILNLILTARLFKHGELQNLQKLMKTLFLPSI